MMCVIICTEPAWWHFMIFLIAFTVSEIPLKMTVLQTEYGLNKKIIFCNGGLYFVLIFYGDFLISMYKGLL